ncbi:ATP-binding protein [Cystobacter ferrugineus]|uniref:histidine kinase n=1 Tax=Cystobacter ferrugineus TaxID=83449 RepID=A0A1L9BFQ1_9BACT|nr:cache domain-containing protein [Cystobacter ferrugineus]OJH41089.1 sensor protein [Cystobacter ferrugineus]
MRTVPGAPLRLTFQRKLLLASAAVLLPVMVLLSVDLVEDARMTRKTLLDAQRLTAHAVAVQVTESFEAAIDLGWALANDPLVRTLNPKLLDAHLLQLTGHHTRFSSVGVYDAQGRNRGWGDPEMPAEPRLWIGDRPYFQKVMATNTPVVSEVLELRRPVRAGLIVAVPIRDARGQPMGVVDVVMETHLLAQRYLSARHHSQQEILLVDPAGRLAFHTHSPTLPFERGLAFASFPPLRAALEGRAMRIDQATDPLTQEDILGAFVPTPRYDWAVGVMASRESAMAPLTQRLYLKLGAVIGIALFSGMLAVVLSRRQTRPVRQLQALAHALGQGDMARRVHIQTGDEMEELGEAFNQMATHIAQRQREVDALRAEAEDHARQLAAIIASVPDAILLASPDGRLFDANPAGLRLLSAEDRSHLDMHLADHLQRSRIRHADGRPLSLEELPLVRALRGETFSDLELRMCSLTGEEYLMSVNGAPVRDATGRIILGEVVLHDITGRKKIEEERTRLLAREQALARIGQALVREVEFERITSVASEQCRQALGADAVGLWLAHPDPSRFTRVAAHGFSSTSREDVEELTPCELPPGAVQDEAIQLIDAQGGGDVCFPGHALAKREGFASVVLIPLHSRGRMVGVLASFSREPLDLSTSEREFHTTVGQLVAVAIEKARLFQEVREALRLREEFMSAAAHELKTPVTTLQTWADILTWKEPGSERQRKGLAAISRGARRLGRLVEHLFTALRMTPGLTKLERDRVDLRALLAEHVASLSRSTEHPIHLVAEETPIIEADRQRMGEVLAHLLENALRYSPPARPIEVRLGCAGNEAVVSVHDHGPGIPPERQPHVFEPLYEPLPSGAPGYAGMAGLGLHLSSRIIEAHGGRIWLESTPGEGTTFCFSLPLHGVEGRRHANA